MKRPKIPYSWENLDFFKGGQWDTVWGNLEKENDWQPAPENIFRALELTPLDKVRVVIIGQDPYPTKGRATGLAFSFPPGEPAQDSLANIYEELEADTKLKRTDGDLTDWAEKGVLLLNRLLTVKVGASNSHLELDWKALTTEIVKVLSEDKTPKAFIFWGKPAKQLAELVDDKIHFIQVSGHPSPGNEHGGFLGSKPFSKVNDWIRDNEWLKKNNLGEIDWSK